MRTTSILMSSEESRGYCDENLDTSLQLDKFDRENTLIITSTEVK